MQPKRPSATWESDFGVLHHPAHERLPLSVPTIALTALGLVFGILHRQPAHGEFMTGKAFGWAFNAWLGNLPRSAALRPCTALLGSAVLMILFAECWAAGPCDGG